MAATRFKRKRGELVSEEEDLASKTQLIVLHDVQQGQEIPHTTQMEEGRGKWNRLPQAPSRTPAQDSTMRSQKHLTLKTKTLDIVLDNRGDGSPMDVKEPEKNYVTVIPVSSGDHAHKPGECAPKTSRNDSVERELLLEEEASSDGGEAEDECHGKQEEVEVKQLREQLRKKEMEIESLRGLVQLLKHQLENREEENKKLLGFVDKVI